MVVLLSGERRIRVHTLCVAVSSQPAHVYAGLNVQAIMHSSTSNDGYSTRTSYMHVSAKLCEM